MGDVAWEPPSDGEAARLRRSHGTRRRPWERNRQRGGRRRGGRLAGCAAAGRRRGGRGEEEEEGRARGWRPGTQAGMERRNKDEDADAGEVAGPAGTSGTRRKKRGGGNRRDDAEAGEDAKEGGSASSVAAMESRPDPTDGGGRVAAAVWQSRCRAWGIGAPGSWGPPTKFWKVS